jgi:hypothetical protein
MSGVTEVRLYCNTIDTVPTNYTNVTAAVLNSSTKDHATGVKRNLDGAATVSGLDPGTNYFWVELVDARGNTAGPQSIGHVRIRHNIDTKLVEHGNNIVAEGDMVLFSGSNSCARFADIAEEGGGYGEFVRSGTWSMTFWIIPLVDLSGEIRFLVLRELDVGLLIHSNKQLYSNVFNEPQLSLTENTWYFFALSVDDYRWAMHTNANEPPGGCALVSTSLGEWNNSSLDSNTMFIGANNGRGASPDCSRLARFWDGYATKVTIDDRRLNRDEATAIYNLSKPHVLVY